MKEGRLWAQRHQLYSRRLRFIVYRVVLSFRREFGSAIFPLFPRARDFAALPEVEEIVTAPPEVVVTQDSFSHLSAMIPDFLVNWRQSKLGTLEALLRESVDLPEHVRATDLAVGQFFQCGYCKRILELRGVLHHNCYQLPRKQRRVYEAVADIALMSRLRTRLIPGTNILRNLLQACGQDYQIATPQDMDQLNMIVYCQTHRYDPEIFRDDCVFREVMEWRTAVRRIPSPCQSTSRTELIICV